MMSRVRKGKGSVCETECGVENYCNGASYQSRESFNAPRQVMSPETPRRLGAIVGTSSGGSLNLPPKLKIARYPVKVQ